MRRYFDLVFFAPGLTFIDFTFVIKQYINLQLFGVTMKPHKYSHQRRGPECLEVIPYCYRERDCRNSGFAGTK